MPHQHLTKYERESIARMWYAGMSLREIGEELGRNKSTISREIRRNSTGEGNSCKYVGVVAHELASERRSSASQGRCGKIQKHGMLRYVKSKLALQWSPEQISGRLNEQRGQDLSRRISHVSIYKWIAQDRANGGQYYRQLRQSNRRRRRKKGSLAKHFAIEGKVSIDDRPKIVERRDRVGDWEGDLVRGQGGKAYLVTLVERTSGLLLMQRVGNKKSHVVRRAIVKLMKRVPRRLLRTLTFDNGTEFSEFSKLEKELKLKVYFAHPYASWERGTNENTNGLIRQYLPKQVNIQTKTTQALARIQQRLNNRPRKRLNYKTPNEVFKK